MQACAEPRIAFERGSEHGSPLADQAMGDRSFVASIGTRFLLIDKEKLKEIDGPEDFYRTLTV